jgi:hypothetical protein
VWHRFLTNSHKSMLLYMLKCRYLTLSTEYCHVLATRHGVWINNWIWCMVGRLNCCWPWPSQYFLASNLVKIYDVDFFSPRHVCVQKRSLLLDKERGGSFCAGAAFVAPYAIRTLNWLHSESCFQVPWDSRSYFTLWRLSQPSVPPSNLDDQS